MYVQQLLLLQYCSFWLLLQRWTKKQIAETGFIIFVACLVQNVSGYIVTYFVCKALSIDVSSRRAMQIEVAMQNSALSVSLALKHFTPQAAVAGAVFSIIHNFTGSIFAGICRKHDDQEKLEKRLVFNWYRLYQLLLTYNYY